MANLVSNMITLSGSITHYPISSERGHYLENFFDLIGRDKISKSLIDFQVIQDWKKEGVWNTCKNAWLFGLSQTSTHHFVMQDDVEVCEYFFLGLERVIKARPNDVLSLMSFPRKKIQEAIDNGINWVQTEGVWGQCVVMPHNIIGEFLDWEQKNIKSNFKHDDSRISLFCLKTNKKIFVPFPTLVDHLDEKSVAGNHWNKPRKSPQFLGNQNPLDYDWSNIENYAQSINSYKQYDGWLIQ